MLKGIDRVISAELLMVLMSMGHGDDLLICDVNHPASSIAKYTTHGRLVNMEGCELPRAAEAILSLMPLDTFVPSPVFRMKVVGDASVSCLSTSGCKPSSTKPKDGRSRWRLLSALNSMRRPGLPLQLSAPRILDLMDVSSYGRASSDSVAGGRVRL